jgi:protein-S-isoprenylcysteine O-methyltransferase Ste14
MRRENSSLMRFAIDIGERLFVVLLGLPFLAAFSAAVLHHPSFILVALSETLAVVLILIRKPGEIAIKAVPVLAAFAGTALPLLVRPHGASIVSPLISSVVMLTGLSLTILSKFYLNRSFGLVAANRGVKVGGPYRIIRHPMYLGYIVNQLGFLLASFNVTNLAIYLVAWVCQIIRVHEEESVLLNDATYQQFAGRVTARLIPGVY